MNAVEKKLWRRARKWVPRLKWVPFLRMAAVCNSLAMGATHHKSDIDLFIVAKPGRLYLVWFFANAFFRICGVRTYGEKTAGRFCLSFFTDERSLDLEKISIKDDAYLKKWIRDLRPIIAEEDVLRQFEKDNLWIGGDFEVRRDFLSQSGSWARVVFEKIFGGWLGDFLEEKIRKSKVRNVEELKLSLKGQCGLFADDRMLKLHEKPRV